MATEVWFKSHTSDGCQSRYYLGLLTKIPLQNVYRSYSVPVISKSTTLAFIGATNCMILVATYRTDLTRQGSGDDPVSASRVFRKYLPLGTLKRRQYLLLLFFGECRVVLQDFFGSFPLGSHSVPYRPDKDVLFPSRHHC
jgi:hypothetical protein